MRINHKYIRNKHFRNKHWNRIKSISCPYETYMPWYGIYSIQTQIDSLPENQVKRHFEWIDEQARYLENGNHRSVFHASSTFRRLKNRQRKAIERNIIQKIRNGNYEENVPQWRKDVDWDYF